MEMVCAQQFFSRDVHSGADGVTTPKAFCQSHSVYAITMDAYIVDDAMVHALHLEPVLPAVIAQPTAWPA